MERKLSGVDIFAGAGGLSLGATEAKIDIKLAVEFDKDAAETYRFNHPNVLLLEENIVNVSPLDYIKEPPFIVFGGPPCQGFSASNTRTRNLNNKKNFLYHEFVRFVQELKPDWFLFENVEGFKRFRQGKVARWLFEAFENAPIKYNLSEKVLCAIDYGVPQKRNRYFLVGNKLNLDFKFPDKLTAKPLAVSDAFSDLPKLKNGDRIYKKPYRKVELSDYAKMMRRNSTSSLQNEVSRNRDYVIERYKYIKPGQNWSAIPPELMKNYKDRTNCHSGIYRRLLPTEPSCVISNYRKNMLIHPFEDRGLSIREAARLQSFPDNFIFKGKLENKQQQIGNAVPPLMAQSVFEAIINQSNVK